MDDGGGMDHDEKSPIVSTKDFEKRFGQSPVFVASTMLDTAGGVQHHSASAGSLLKEAIHVISCGYEDKTEWGKEVNFRPQSPVYPERCYHLTVIVRPCTFRTDLC